MRTILRNAILFCTLAFAVHHVYAQDLSRDEIKQLRDVTLGLLKKTQSLNATSGLRSSFFNQPDSITSFFWDDDIANAELLLTAALTWRVIQGQRVVDQVRFSFAGLTFQIRYNYDAQVQISGGVVSILLGPLPIPAGNIVVNRDQRGNMTRVGLNLDILGNQIAQGDSANIAYDNAGRIESVARFYLDEETNQWVPSGALEDITYCEDEGRDYVCSFTEVFVGFDPDGNPIVFSIFNTNCGWWEDADQLYIQSYLPNISDALPSFGDELFPQDPIISNLKNQPIAGEIRYSYDPETEGVISGFIDDETDQYCLFIAYYLIGEEDPVFVTDVRCHSFDDDGRLIGVNIYADLDLEILLSSRTYQYNDFDLLSSDEFSAGGFSERTLYDFVLDQQDRLRRYSSSTSTDGENGESFIFGEYYDYHYNPASSVVDESIFKTFEVFPNPTADFIFIATELGPDTAQRMVDFQVRSISGTNLLTKREFLVERQIVELSVQTLPAGIYVLEAYDAAQKLIGSLRFVKK